MESNFSSQLTLSAQADKVLPKKPDETLDSIEEIDGPPNCSEVDELIVNPSRTSASEPISVEIPSSTGGVFSFHESNADIRHRYTPNNSVDEKHSQITQLHPAHTIRPSIIPESVHDIRYRQDPHSEGVKIRKKCLNHSLDVIDVDAGAQWIESNYPRRIRLWDKEGAKITPSTSNVMNVVFGGYHPKALLPDCSTEKDKFLTSTAMNFTSLINHRRGHKNINEVSIERNISSINRKNKFKVFGRDLSHYSRRYQFFLCAGGSFVFSLLYGYIQELISVHLCHRKLGLFLAASQFFGYTVFSYFFRNLDKCYSSTEDVNYIQGSVDVALGAGNSNSALGASKSQQLHYPPKLNRGGVAGQIFKPDSSNLDDVPLNLYIGLSILRAVDLGMTNLAMQYVNYPAKTLMKSTRVVFTMFFGILVTNKRYKLMDFLIVGFMVVGLTMFMHADANTSAVFQPLGLVMLTISLLCDGAISNLSEDIMNKYEVGQDEFIFRLYSVALFFVCIAAGVKGDLRDGFIYLSTPGTLNEMENRLDPTWSTSGKIVTMILLSTTGFLSSSCAAAITKSFGAFAMSITSTVRKAATIFLSFLLFPNKCTFEHIVGIVLFIGSLAAKSLRACRQGHYDCENEAKNCKSVIGSRHLTKPDMIGGEMPVPETKRAIHCNASAFKQKDFHFTV